MKKVIMIIAVAAILVGCKGKGTRVQISDSVDKFNVEKLFVVESILWKEESWRHSISRCQIIKWAYLSDILPKQEGGEQ
ncbi:hypothetical protein [Segatella copri]|uniref:hypothetical protein n=1 Tax=Segatella copri TaxID=165179 RepID=UPI0022E51461|nr:hypothetical protein [Segatella copri]